MSNQQIIKSMLETMPDNGTVSRRLRRWNVEHHFLLTWVIYAVIFNLVIEMIYG